MGAVNKKWSDIELNILKDNYAKGGPKLCQKNRLNRPIASIISKANKRELVTGKYSDRTQWSTLELNILETYYTKGGYFLCQQKGLNRSAASIRSYAYRKGYNYKTR